MQTILIHQWNYYISRQFNMRSKGEFVSNEKAINVKRSTLYHALVQFNMFMHWNWQGERGQQCEVEDDIANIEMYLASFVESKWVYRAWWWRYCVYTKVIQFQKNWIRCVDKLPGTGKKRVSSSRPTLELHSS